MLEQWLIFLGSGIFSGLLAGFLGIGGGTILVPLLLALGYEPKQAIATSVLALLLTAVSGTWQNWRMGYLNPRHILYLGIPALLAAQVGVYIADLLPSVILLFAFGSMLVANIYLFEGTKEIRNNPHQEPSKLPFNPLISRIFTGSTAGVLAGLFGIGGGVILVPLQMLLLGSKLAAAIQTSLGVIVITAISAFIGHSFSGNVLFIEGSAIGVGGIIGAQFSTRFLPKLPTKVVGTAFPTLLAILALYTFWKAWISYSA